MKWKRLSIAVIIIGLLALTVFLWSRPKDAEMKIAEIPNTHCFATTNSTDYRYYFVSDPDESLDAIKSLIEDFMAEHKDEIRSYMESNACIAWLFFRETRLINENWVEGGGYFKEDYIEWHKDDVIASIYAEEGEIAYAVMNRSDGLFSYGDVLERREYVGWILQDGTVSLTPCP